MSDITSAYKCRECGIENIEPGTEIAGDVLCWQDEDLCSRCHDWLHQQLELDAQRYRYIRNRQTRPIDIFTGGIFAGRVGDNVIIAGEDLDRAIDRELDLDLPQVPTLERRLADCLAGIIDEPLLTGRDGGISSPLEIRLGFFKPELSERAAVLLEEAGL